MRALTRALASAAAAVGLAAVPTAAIACHRHVAGMRLAVPAYFYPGQYWTQLGDAAPTVGLAVANPNSGPGSALNTDYATAISNARHAGVKVIGYVDTGYFGTTGRMPARSA